MLKVILEAVLESFPILLYLFLIYLFLEVLEDAKNTRAIRRSLSGRFAPLMASLTGVVPECGFSIFCAKMFDGGFITIGALLSAFLSTNDEGLVVLISGGAGWQNVLILIAFKTLYAMALGYLANLFLGKITLNNSYKTHNNHIKSENESHKFLNKYLLHPLLHSSLTFIIIVLEEITLGLLIYAIGEDAIISFINRNLLLQPLVSSLIGLIPTCASSVILAQSFIDGLLGFGGLVAGLTSNAGLGIMILLKSNKSRKIALTLFGVMYVLGVLAGYIAILIGL